MGTRSYTHVFEGDTLLVSIYRQYDGYPSGHGRDVKDALGSRQLVNGIRGEGRDEVVNGMSCAAALLVAHLKSDMEAGGIYIEKPDASQTEEYTYYISGKSYEGGFLGNDGKKTINLRVVSGYYGEIYNGPIEDFDPDMEYGED